jgi:hypothetical protein
MAALDEHVVDGGHHDLVGESIRAVAGLPAVMLGRDDTPTWRSKLASQPTNAAAVLTRLALSVRGESVPSPQGLVELLVEQSPGGKGNPFVSEDPWAGRVAYIVFLAGEMAHVTDNAEADRIGALLTLYACLESLTALAPGGPLASQHDERATAAGRIVKRVAMSPLRVLLTASTSRLARPLRADFRRQFTRLWGRYGEGALLGADLTRVRMASARASDRPFSVLDCATERRHSTRPDGPCRLAPA